MKRKNKVNRKHHDAIPRNRRQADMRERSLAVLAVARREKVPLQLAARIEGIQPKTVLRYAGSGFKKHGKEYRAKKSDRIPRTLTVLDSKGTRGLTTHSPKTARRISQYWSAVGKAQRTGNYAALNKFRGERVPYSGFNFIVSPAKLKKFADAGILDFEKLYWRGGKK
jgi:hypothetical protein